MKIPYRTRKLLQRIGIGVLILLLVAVLTVVGGFLWSDKYIYYTRDGAVMDRDLPPISQEGQLATPHKNEQSIPIYYDDGQRVSASTELTQLVGYYIDAETVSVYTN